MCTAVKVSSSKCSRAPLVALFWSQFSLMLLFFKIPAPQKAQLLPTSYSSTSIDKGLELGHSQNIQPKPFFNIYLMTSMNEKVSCVEKLVINFATSIITALIVFAQQGHIFNIPWFEWMHSHSHWRDTILKIAITSSANSQDIIKSMLLIKRFWYSSDRMLYLKYHLYPWYVTTLLHRPTA